MYRGGHFVIIFTLLAILVILLFYRGYKNTQHLVVNTVSVSESDRQANQSLCVLHISDMHLERISVTPDQLYEKLRHKRIDLIALTGDFADRKKSIPKMIPYLKMFSRLKPLYGMYAVFGNHDYWLKTPDFQDLKEVLEKHGCKTMQNENEAIIIDGKQLNIIGIDDAGSSRGDIDKAFNGVANGYNLVLTHDPNIVLDMDHVSFDYLLAGHFHGGQIHWPKPYHLVKMGKLVRLKMVKGLHHHKGQPFYISEGLGQTGLNIRLGSRPEITLHHLALDVLTEKRNTLAG
ncbi:metallophosphoesterase [Shouchella clausii]|uniref:Metallophosphoesterase n=1 Tax=Shouchella clausii TaxID=79880 RepID=A0A268S0M4_SHOCL|nr:metallophosphoesterase [Shouchella clausii]PAF26093.1 metallophosphoesterase [Shouchella clausii]